MSDTMFRALLPPELRVVTNNYKQTCCCEMCCFMNYLQAAINKFRVIHLAEIKKELKKLEDAVGGGRPTRAQISAIDAATSKLETYKLEAFAPDGGTLHPKAKDAAYSVQCPSPPGFEDTGITRLECASGNCPNCPAYCRPCEEGEAKRAIKYYSFKNMPTCSNCGALSEKAKTCSNCITLYKSESKRGKVGTRKHLVWNHDPLSVFNKLYDLMLPKYNLHRFKFSILSKQMVIDVRLKTLKPGEVYLQHDFSETLKVIHNEEVCIV